MKWFDRRMVFFDLETTGVNPHTDRIVSAAVIEAGGGGALAVREWLVDPGIEIPAGASAVHGITTARAREDGAEAGAAVGEIGEILVGLIHAGLAVVGHNVRYDLTMLHAEMVRHGHDRPAAGLVAATETGLVVDTLVLDKYTDRFRRGSRKLVDVAAHHGVHLGADAHGAVADAMAAGRVAWCIGARFPEIGALSDLALMELQRVAAREQAESLGAWLSASGRTDDVCRTWPLEDVGHAVSQNGGSAQGEKREERETDEQ